MAARIVSLTGRRLAHTSAKSSHGSIDVHTHVYLPRYMDILRRRAVQGLIPRVVGAKGNERLIILPGEDKEGTTAGGRPVGPEYFDVNTKLAFMDTHNIKASVISLANPWLDFLGVDDAVESATALNDDLQATCTSSATKNRLYGFGVLPMQDVAAAVAEVRRLRSLSRLRGVVMSTAGRGKGLDDATLSPLWEELAASKLMVFLHPHYGVGNEHFGNAGHSLFLALGFTFETTTAVARLILSGAFDRHPELKLLLAHTGGTLPFLAGRLDSCVKHDHAMHGRLQHPPSYYLRRLYYDALCYHAPAIRCAIDFAGADRLMFGTDNPFFPPLGQSPSAKGVEWASTTTNYDALASLDAASRRAICRDNAERILGIKAPE